MAEPSDDRLESTEPEPTAPTEPDPRDAEMAELRASLNANQVETANLRGSYDTLLASTNAGNAPPVVTPEPPPTVEQIEAALQAGESAAPLIAKLVSHTTNEVRAGLEAKLAAMATRVDTYGLGAIAEHARHIAGLQTGEDGKPKLKYYGRFKKEIDTVVAGMPTESQLTPDAIVGAHQYVVGQHMDDIIKEEVEARLRAAGGDPNMALGTSGGNGRSNTSTHVPDAAEAFGNEYAAAVKAKGGEDAFAKKMNYDGWEDYLQKTGVIDAPKTKAA